MKKPLTAMVLVRAGREGSQGHRMEGHTDDQGIPSLQNLASTSPRMYSPFILRVYLLSPTDRLQGTKSGRGCLGGVKLRGFAEK